MMLSIVLMASCEKEPIRDTCGATYLNFDKQSHGDVLSVPKEGGTYRFRVLNLPKYEDSNIYYANWFIGGIILENSEGLTVTYNTEYYNYRENNKADYGFNQGILKKHVDSFNPFVTPYATAKITYAVDGEDDEQYVDVTIHPNNTGKELTIAVSFDVMIFYFGFLDFKVAAE